MPVCPGRVNGFSRKTMKKPFTLHRYTGHRIVGAANALLCTAYQLNITLSNQTISHYGKQNELIKMIEPTPLINRVTVLSEFVAPMESKDRNPWQGFRGVSMKL